MKDKHDTQTSDLLKGSTRQGRYAERQRQMGRRQRSFWLTDCEAESVAKLLERLRRVETAQQWRTENGYTGRGGIVVLHDGNPCGWVAELCDPETWEPGCIAVNEDGRTWQSIAGDADDGALMWLPLDPL